MKKLGFYSVIFQNDKWSETLAFNTRQDYVLFSRKCKAYRKYNARYNVPMSTVRSLKADWYRLSPVSVTPISTRLALNLISS